MTEPRIQRDHNAVVAKHDDGRVIVLEYTFSYGGNLHGATGTELYPVTRDVVRDAMREKQQYLQELADDCDIHGEQRRQLMSMLKEEYLEMRFESFAGLTTQEIAETAGHDAGDIERYALSSCGRIFPRALEGAVILNAELVDEITSFEAAVA